MSFGLYAIGFANLDRRADLRRVTCAYARAMDYRGRDRTLRRWDSVGCKGDASERPVK
jgi:hypothetical protein